MVKGNKLFVVTILTLTVILMLSIFCGKIFKTQIADAKKNSKNTKQGIDIDWEQLYPYDTSIDYEVTDTDSSGIVEKMEKIMNMVGEFGTIGMNWSKLMYKYDEISKIGLSINSKLTDVSMNSSYIKLENGYWVRRSTSLIAQADADEAIAEYSALQRYLKSEGIEFLYCSVPGKECRENSQLPAGVEITNENIDLYINALKNYNVNFIDMRELIHQDGMEHYSLFYKTDHHWNVKAGMWAASAIEDELSEMYGIEMENPSSFGTFTEKVYENAMFGSEGQAVTHVIEESEDFSIYYPDFGTAFRLEIPDYEIDEEGSFEDIFIDYEGLEEVIAEGGGYAYEKILYGNRPYEKITNLNNPDGPKIFVIKDSFGIAVAPYLALSCSELVLVDTRSTNGNMNGSIISCIDDFNPDIVLTILYSPQELNLNNQY